MSASAWLMKAEPESRIVNGKDVAFSAHHFEKAGTEHWDGVRNHQAKNFMKEKMKIGDRILFYHSNCKVPGIAALAEVAKEGYPDFTAFDSSHPYYDPKSSRESPTWYMVDVRFVSHLAHLVPLSLLQKIAQTSHSDLPASVSQYLTPEHIVAIKEMPLLARGRLSVQPVSDLAYEAAKALGENGGWEALDATKAKTAGRKRKPARKGGDAQEIEEAERSESNQPTNTALKAQGRNGGRTSAARKLEETAVDNVGTEGSRRSKRARKS